MEQNLNHWLRSVMDGRRPGYALVISGPQGVGKTTLTTQLAYLARLPINDSNAPDGATLRVIRDGAERRIPRDEIKAMITAERFAPACLKGDGREVATPVAVIIETTAPSAFKQTADRRFFHIRLGA